MEDNLKELSEEEKEQLKIYAKDNKYLYEVLCSCWKNGIRTYACSAGETLENVPYLGMYLDKNSLAYIKRIIAKLQGMKDITMTCDIKKDKEEILGIEEINKCFEIKGQPSNRCEIFYRINQAIENKDEKIKTDLRSEIFYRDVLDFYKMDDSELIHSIAEGNTLKKEYSNTSLELVKYQKGSKGFERIKRLPIIKKIIELFSSKQRKQNREYELIKNKYENVQNYFEPKLQEKIGKLESTQKNIEKQTSNIKEREFEDKQK